MSDVVMSFVERVNQSESLVNWGLTAPPAVCDSVIMGGLIQREISEPFQKPSERDHQAVMCKACWLPRNVLKI